jgi:hypothetical protein
MKRNKKKERKKEKKKKKQKERRREKAKRSFDISDNYFHEKREGGSLLCF